LDTVILPKRNEKDLEDVPAEVRKAMTFVLAERIDDAIEAGLMSAGDDVDVADPNLNRIYNRPEIEFSPASVSSKKIFW
jgi:predicted ATP-dependent protease